MKVLVAGDYCPQGRVSDRFMRKDYQSVLGDVKDSISNVDYSIVNLECPICSGGEMAIHKCGPNLKCLENGIEAAIWAGFNCFTLANNHFLDYGKEGVKNTLDACVRNKIDKVGGGESLEEASKTLYKKIEGKIIAVINCCEHEFSIATDTTAGSNPLNPIQQYYAIKKARTLSDYVLVIVHGGHEHYQLPSVRMQETYRFFIDAGADAVVNHHQHCYSGYEYYNDKPIVYGLGNFCFDEGYKGTNLWHEGYMVEINFSDNISIVLHPYTQCAEDAVVKFVSDPTDFKKSIEYLNGIISDAKLLKEKQNEYYKNSVMSSRLLFEPINFRYAKALQRRGWLPFLHSRYNLTRIFNYINCEAHRDKVLYALTHLKL